MKAEVLMLLVQKVSQSWKQLLMWMDKVVKIVMVVLVTQMNVWIKVLDTFFVLTFEDEHILEQGKKFIDKHINCTQGI